MAVETELWSSARTASAAKSCTSSKQEHTAPSLHPCIHEFHAFSCLLLAPRFPSGLCSHIPLSFCQALALVFRLGDSPPGFNSQVHPSASSGEPLSSLVNSCLSNCSPFCKTVAVALWTLCIFLFEGQGYPSSRSFFSSP